jgi:hypothetical protein
VIGEILSCLYVGLCRWHRGEGLSAFRFVQGHAFNLLQEAIALVEEPAAGVAGDLYTKDRRFEARYPWTQDRLGSWLAGYDRTPQAALAILAFVEDRFSVAPAIRDAILSLANGTPA